MKTINIKLSEASIDRAIRQLEAYRDSLDQKAERLVSSLVKNGAEIASGAFGNSVNVTQEVNGTEGAIVANGDAVMFMEFGAGLATMEGHPLAGNAPVTVKKWEYSRTEGSGEGYRTGQWHFGGKVYTEVVPRHGILDARDYILEHAEDEARRAFR